MNKLLYMASNALGITSQNSQQPEMKKPVDPMKELGPKEVFLAWEITPEMPKMVFDQKGKRTIIVVLSMLGLLLLLMQEFWIILMGACIAFFLYVVSNTAAVPINYELSSYGLKIEEKTYYWNELKRYFFVVTGASEVLVIDTYLNYPARFYISFEQRHKSKIESLLADKLEFCKDDPTGSLSKSVTRFTQKFDFNQKKS